MSFNYFISKLKSMLETLLIKNLDKYPEKLKILDYSKAPIYEYLILKIYGFGIKHVDQIDYYVGVDWRNNVPTDPNAAFKEILRNR